jgi:mannose-6-phosphate isomerase-like protein (cupin superfamily)
MAAFQTYVAHREDLEIETFEWGTLCWLCNDKLSPGAEQTLGICQIRPGCKNPVHYHPNCEEVLYLLAGTGLHSFAGEVVPLQANSTIRIPAGVRHNLWNTGDEAIVCLISFSSGKRETVLLQ